MEAGPAAPEFRGIMFVLVKISTLLFMLATPAGAAERLENAWEKALDRYIAIVHEAAKAPLEDGKRKEAGDILAKFRVIISSPVYDVPLPEVKRTPAATPELQARAVLNLLNEMADIQRRLGNISTAEEGPLPLKSRFMGCRRDAAAALDSLALFPERSPAPKPGKKRKLGLKSLGCAPPGDLPLQEAFPGTTGGRFSCVKTFRMKGHFQAEFPCWLWYFWARKSSEGLQDPYSVGNTGPQGLWISDDFPMQMRTSPYTFKWKADGGDTSQPYVLAEKTKLNPDVTGIAARETPSEVELYPELKGTNFQLRGFQTNLNGNNSCFKYCGGEWNISLDAVYWPTSESCSSWLSKWEPGLPGDKTSDLEPLEADKGTPEPDGIFERPYEMTYNKRIFGARPCTLPQRVRILCAKGPKGLYTFALDASEDVFDTALPVLERLRSTFNLQEQPAPDRAAGLKTPPVKPAPAARKLKKLILKR